MNDIEFLEYLSKVREMKNADPSLRMGQCYYNAFPDATYLTKQIVGTIYDPFYDDENIGAFLERVYRDQVLMTTYFQRGVEK